MTPASGAQRAEASEFIGSRWNDSQPMSGPSPATSPTPTTTSGRCSPRSASPTSTRSSRACPRSCGSRASSRCRASRASRKWQRSSPLSPPATRMPAPTTGSSAPASTRTTRRQPSTRWSRAPSSPPPTRRISPRSPRARCRPSSSGRRWSAASRASRSRTRRSTTAPPPTAEAVLMALRLTRRKKVVLAHGLHPHYGEVLDTYVRALDVPIVDGAARRRRPQRAGRRAGRRRHRLRRRAAARASSARVQDLAAIGAAARARGALFVVVVNEALSLGLLRAPGDLGADIVCGEAQSFGVPMAFGGPALGFLATRDRHVRQMPGRLCGADRRRARQARLRAHALDARTAHPPREGDVEHLHQPGPLPADRDGLPVAARPRRARRARAPELREGGVRQAADPPDAGTRPAARGADLQRVRRLGARRAGRARARARRGHRRRPRTRALRTGVGLVAAGVRHRTRHARRDRQVWISSCRRGEDVRESRTRLQTPGPRSSATPATASRGTNRCSSSAAGRDASATRCRTPTCRSTDPESDLRSGLPARRSARAARALRSSTWCATSRGSPPGTPPSISASTRSAPAR